MSDARRDADGVEALSRNNYQRLREREGVVAVAMAVPARGHTRIPPQAGRAGRPRDGRRAVAVMVACCIVVPLALMAVFSLSTQGAAGVGGDSSRVGMGLAADAGAPSSGEPVSTPQDQWQKGTVPYLFQTDSQWANAPYAGTTVSEAGCGPTCLTMAYIALTGSRDYDPAKMAQFSESNGFLDGGLTTWTFMTEGAQKLGLKSQELPADAARVARAVGEGHPVILTLGPGDFTSTGHFVVVASVDDDGNWMIRDPNSPQRSGQAWDPQRVLGQCRNLWEISPGGWL